MFLLYFSLCRDCWWHPGTPCLIARANFNAYHHSTPTVKAALRSCLNMKVITDLATGSRFSSAVSYVSINTAPPHQSWGAGGVRSWKPPANKLTLLFFLQKPARALPLFFFVSFLTEKHTEKSSKAPAHPNKHAHARKWLVCTRRGRVMHSLVQIVWLQWSQSNIQTDFGQSNSYGLQRRTNQRRPKSQTLVHVISGS